MTDMDPVMEPIFTKLIPCPGVAILKMIPCSAAHPRTENYMSTSPGASVQTIPAQFENGKKFDRKKLVARL